MTEATLITSLIVHPRRHRLTATCSMLLFALLLSGCGGDGSTAPAPVIANAAGTWVGPFRIATVSGGECGDSLQYLVNSTATIRLNVQQNGTELTADTRLPGSATCLLTGSASPSGISLTVARCDMPPNTINYTVCAGAGRELSTRSLSLSLTITGNSASGQFTQVENARAVGGDITSSHTFTGNVTLTR